MRRNIVTLANSSMYGGRCIAGKDLNTKEWIRLKSPFENVGLSGAFSNQDLFKLCGNRNGPQLLDVWEISFGEKCPSKHQPENITVECVSWKKKNTDFCIDNLVDCGDCGWFNSGYPVNKIYKSKFESQKYLSSLIFLCLSHENNRTHIVYRPNGNGQYKPRLIFFYNSQHFDLPITDVNYPIIYNEVPSQELQVAYITVGLGQEYNEAYYKLVVGIIPHNKTNKKVIV
jgi:hypothetical protein